MHGCDAHTDRCCGLSWQHDIFPLYLVTALHQLHRCAGFHFAPPNGSRLNWHPLGVRVTRGVRMRILAECDDGEKWCFHVQGLCACGNRETFRTTPWNASPVHSMDIKAAAADCACLFVHLLHVFSYREWCEWGGGEYWDKTSSWVPSCVFQAGLQTACWECCHISSSKYKRMKYCRKNTPTPLPPRVPPFLQSEVTALLSLTTQLNVIL